MMMMSIGERVPEEVIQAIAHQLAEDECMCTFDWPTALTAVNMHCETMARNAVKTLVVHGYTLTKTPAVDPRQQAAWIETFRNFVRADDALWAFCDGIEKDLSIEGDFRELYAARDAALAAITSEMMGE